MRAWEVLYARNGVKFVRNGLLLLHLFGLALMVGCCFLMQLLITMSLNSQLFVILLSVLIFLIEAALAIRSMQPAVAALEIWRSAQDESSALAAWPVLVELPFAPLRSWNDWVIVGGLILGWDVAVALHFELSGPPVAILAVASLLLWLHWLALRFFATERFVRPALAEISIGSCCLPTPMRITLTVRLIVAIPAMAVIAATAIAQLLITRPSRTFTIGSSVIVLISIGVAGWLMMMLAQSVTEPINNLRDAAEQIGHGNLQVRLPVVSVDEIGLLSYSFNTMATGLRDRDYIRDTFGAYVDPSVAEHLLAGAAKLAYGEEVEITALFLDVRGFTGYAEQRTAAEVVSMLNRLFELTVPIVARHNGHVDKFIGDGLLAVFGTPRPLVDHADHALNAAVEIATAVANRPHDDPGIGIGINSGFVVAGNIGGSGRFDFSVIGDVVNVAARVESATRYTGDLILISEHTRLLLSSHAAAALAARPPVPMKGKTRAVAVYAPTADDATPVRRTHK